MPAGSGPFAAPTPPAEARLGDSGLGFACAVGNGCARFDNERFAGSGPMLEAAVLTVLPGAVAFAAAMDLLTMKIPNRIRR